MNEAKFPYQWVAIGFTVLTMLAGFAASTAVQAEKLKQVECKTAAIQDALVVDQKEINTANSEEHKKIMASLIRIETILSAQTRYQRQQRELNN